MTRALPSPSHVPRGWSESEVATAWFRAWLHARHGRDAALAALAQASLRDLGVEVGPVRRAGDAARERRP